jgi:predicted Rossmann-fold nucleotide-binding protein
VDTEMFCPKGKCGCQYFIVSFGKVTRYKSFCLIFFGEDIYRHVLLSNAIHLLNKIFFKLNIVVQIHVADSCNTVGE